MQSAGAAETTRKPRKKNPGSSARTRLLRIHARRSVAQQICFSSRCPPHRAARAASPPPPPPFPRQARRRPPACLTSPSSSSRRAVVNSFSCQCRPRELRKIPLRASQPLVLFGLRTASPHEIAPSPRGPALCSRARRRSHVAAAGAEGAGSPSRVRRRGPQACISRPRHRHASGQGRVAGSLPARVRGVRDPERAKAAERQRLWR